MPKMQRTLLFLFLLPLSLFAQVEVGLDRIFTDEAKLIKNKTIGLVTNNTAIDKNGNTAVELFLNNQDKYKYTLKAFFAPEHGLFGEEYAGKAVATSVVGGVPVHSLFGANRRPSSGDLFGIDLLVFDIQDIGSRPYTFQTTLYYVMEEASKLSIPVVVLDRPNPLGGQRVEGPMLDDGIRSFIGYVNIPYVHGMTSGELATFFNEEYKVGCNLTVAKMRGWKRSMCFDDTGRMWVPTSPNIPEATTPFFFPMTGLIGELGIKDISIGIGYTLPFKVVAAPWIDPLAFRDALLARKLPGVSFVPIHFLPFTKKEEVHGVLIIINNYQEVRPMATGFAILATLKALYPAETATLAGNTDLFVKACGSKQILQMLQKSECTFRELYEFHKDERKKFMATRAKYLFPEY